MNIPASADTLTKVAWYAVREVMANLVPQFDYSAQPMTLDGVLFMLADLIVYALNKAADLNPNAGVLRAKVFWLTVRVLMPPSWRPLTISV